MKSSDFYKILAVFLQSHLSTCPLKIDDEKTTFMKLVLNKTINFNRKIIQVIARSYSKSILKTNVNFLPPKTAMSVKQKTHYSN